MLLNGFLKALLGLFYVYSHGYNETVQPSFVIKHFVCFDTIPYCIPANNV